MGRWGLLAITFVWLVAYRMVGLWLGRCLSAVARSGTDRASWFAGVCLDTGSLE